MPKCDINKVENTFSKEHPWAAASDWSLVLLELATYLLD